MADNGVDHILALADQIGERIASGNLPRQDEFGRYIFSDADLTFEVR